MALDGLYLRAIVHQLQSCVGGRIGKIHQPHNSDIVLNIRSQRNNYRLLVSANPTYPRVHLTSRTFLNPPEAPMFCMLLRKHLENGIIEFIEQDDLERIIKIGVKKQDEIGDTGIKTLIIEMMGRHSNIIMIDPGTNTIVDSIHHITPAISSYRIVMPGSAYVGPPDQQKQNPLQVEVSDFSMALQTMEHTTESLIRGIVRSFNGISPLIATEIVYRARENEERHTDSPNMEISTLWRAFEQIMNTVRQHHYRPNIVETSDKSNFSIVELTHLAGERTEYSGASECLEAYYGDKAQRDVVRQKTTDLSRWLINEKSKNEKKLIKLEETIVEAQDADKYRIIGELLTSSMHLITKGDKKVEVINYYDEDQAMLEVSLDPQLSPSENVQRYFKRYTKSKNSVVAVQEQIKTTQAEIMYFDTLLQQIADADMNDIEEIREELISEGYLRDRNKKARRTNKKSEPRPLTFHSSEGIPIYVGKNNVQNDYITNKLARSNDTWLHTKDIPGSHVVIRSSTYGNQTLQEAAQCAAYFSQAKASSSVPVDYTLIKHVRKPNGAKPGFVIYEQQKTLFITPDKPFVDKLISNAEKKV